MNLLPPLSVRIPLFASSFDAAITLTAKKALASSVTFTALGVVFILPLLITTHAGAKKESQLSFFSTHILTPLGCIATACSLVGIAALATLIFIILVDLTHRITFGHHAMHYNAVFMPITIGCI